MKLLLPLLLTITTSLAMETNQSSVTLPGSAWEVTTYAGQIPLADHPITFEFDTEGNIAGDASCNRFGGTCTIEDNTIIVGPLRSTRRACEPEIMQQEHKFLALLGSVTTWQIDSDGVLVLIGEEGEIRAKKWTETPEN
ncbi:MAG: META domain-containing protein [Chthoniobacterales bacterium]